MKLHVIMSGLVLTCLIISGVLLFYGYGVEQYSPSDYDNSSLAAVASNLDTMRDISNRTSQDIQNLESSNPLDLIGAMFNSAYGSVLIAAESLSVAQKMAIQGVTGLEIGSFANNVIATLITLIMIAISVGIILHLITKSDRA